MGRPKGSKNKVKRTAIKGPISLDEQISQTKAQMDSLAAEIDGLSDEIRQKKKRMSALKRSMTGLLAQKEQTRQAEEDARRMEAAKRVADAFLASGKRVEDILPLLEVPAGAN